MKAPMFQSLLVKVHHAVDFLCDDMKVKMVLKFRGREMAHKEFGFQTVQKFISQLVPFAHPDNEPKLVGRGITVMLSPLPRNKRAKNPYEPDSPPEALHQPDRDDSDDEAEEASAAPTLPSPAVTTPGGEPAGPVEVGEKAGFLNNPFAQLNADLVPSSR